MKKIILYSILNFLILNIVLAQSRNNDRKISNAYFKVISKNYSIKDSLFLTYQENQWSYSSGVPRKVVNGKIGYELQIPFKNGEIFQYGSLSIGQCRDLLIENIIEPKDSIIFNVLRNSIKIDGRGKEKYLLVQELENELELFNFLRGDSLSKASQLTGNRTSMSEEVNTETVKRGLRTTLEYNQKKKKIVLALLEKYKQGISPEIYELLKLDYLSKLENDYLKSFNDGFNYIIYMGKENADSSFRVLEDVNSNKLNYINQVVQNVTLCALSKEFIDYVLQDIRTRKFNPMTKATYNTKTIIDYIIDNYSGLLRDRLLTSYLIRNKIKSGQEGQAMSYALKHIKSDYCIELLQKSLGHSSPGSIAFEFALTDTLGNVVKQNDFKGKVALLDFFFTGCGSCKILKEKMIPLVEFYRDNPNMKFVSVNIDKDRKEWKNSIRSLEYTHKGSIDLFTDGEAGNAKIIQHYNIRSYPTLILIGKDGKIISANPPEPHDNKKRGELIEMINKALK